MDFRPCTSDQAQPTAALSLVGGPDELINHLQPFSNDTSRPEGTSSIYDGLEQKRFQTLERLHHCQTSTKYAAAMSDEQRDWNFDRDVAFAMGVLLPWTKELLNGAGTPTADFFKDCRWLDTRDPGAYAYKATKRDRHGKIIAVILKTGCAWSVKGGLKARKAQHLNEKLSKH
jgi:hypothetical protein